jgi:Rps23 Pro-64 3,4-dihydroxylase Tpa1-like proline 4-hydroxylase
MMDLLNEIDRDRLKQDFFASEGFPHFCIDNFLKEDFAEEIYQSFPSFQEAQKLGKEFSAVNEKRKVQITDSAKFSPAIQKLNQLLCSKEYLDMWSEITGIPNLFADAELVGGGIHETNTGGHLDVHVDFNFNNENRAYRRLNILIYFNKDWKEGYGGYLDLWDKDVKKRIGYFEPKFNRACGFITSEISFHGVTPLTCPLDVMRKSFATYYYTKEEPKGWAGDKHSTIFKARPDEWAKDNVLMPLEKASRSLKSRIRGIKGVVKRIIK